MLVSYFPSAPVWYYFTRVMDLCLGPSDNIVWKYTCIYYARKLRFSFACRSDCFAHVNIMYCILFPDRIMIHCGLTPSNSETPTHLPPHSWPHQDGWEKTEITCVRKLLGWLKGREATCQLMPQAKWLALREIELFTAH